MMIVIQYSVTVTESADNVLRWGDKVRRGSGVKSLKKLVSLISPFIGLVFV